MRRLFLSPRLARLPPERRADVPRKSYGPAFHGLARYRSSNPDYHLAGVEVVEKETPQGKQKALIHQEPAKPVT
jgi:hypothetical protein